MFRVDESSVFEVPGGKKVTFFKLNFRRGEKWVRADILIIFEVGPGPAAADLLPIYCLKVSTFKVLVTHFDDVFGVGWNIENRCFV